MKKRKITSYIFPAINTVLMIFIIIITIYPFWNQFILSFAKKEYLYAVEAQWYPKSVDLSSYKVLLHYKDVWIGYLNTIIRTVVGTVLSLIVTALMAYPLTKSDIPFRKAVTMLIMFTMLFSGGLIPTYILITQQLHLSNSFWVTILPMLTSAYNIFIMRNFIIGIPGELEESALIDGAGYFTIFRKITLPQMKWGLIYGIILCTARALGEFGAVNALSKTRGQTFTLPLEIDALYMSGTDTSITSAFAVSSILVIIAVIVLILRNIFEYRSKNSKGIQ